MRGGQCRRAAAAHMPWMGWSRSVAVRRHACRSARNWLPPTDGCSGHAATPPMSTDRSPASSASGMRNRSWRRADFRCVGEALNDDHGVAAVPTDEGGACGERVTRCMSISPILRMQALCVYVLSRARGWCSLGVFHETNGARRWPMVYGTFVPAIL